MNFINGYVFWILPFVLAAMVIVYFHANTRRRAALKMVTGNRPEAAASVHLSEFKRGWRFVLLLAVIALLGIAMQDAVVMVSDFKELRREGKSLYDAILLGSEVRFRSVESMGKIGDSGTPIEPLTTAEGT